MEVILIEDEPLARAKLVSMLHLLNPSIRIIAQLGSVKESIQWLEQNPSPDLAFVDIQLSDDHSFEIFHRIPVKFPVIFTTAYDKYLLQSFEFNSIDYLLKPITEEKLRRSLLKMQNLQHHFLSNGISKLIQHPHSTIKSRIVARRGADFVTLSLDEVAYFFTEHKIVFARDFSGKQLIVDENLGELEAVVDRQIFFRINRKFIVQLKAIERFKPDQGKIQIFLRPEMKEDVYVSKETAPDFRNWIRQG